MTNRMQPMRVLVLGMGDLGVRIAQKVIEGVRAKFGVRLEPEPVVV